MARKRRSDQIFIGFTGKAGAGKDYVAVLLGLSIVKDTDLSVARLPWAEGVRRELSETLSPNGTLEALWAKPTTDDVRALLQFWGTDYRRAQDPDYWVDYGLDRAAEMPYDVILFTDTRFHNEVAAIEDNGFIVNVQAEDHVRLKRVGGVRPHESEAYADDLSYKYRVSNNGTPEDNERVERLVLWITALLSPIV